MATLTRLLRAAGFDPEVSLQAVPPDDERVRELLAVRDEVQATDRTRP